MSDFHLLLQEEIPSLVRYAAALTRDRDAAVSLVEDTVIDMLDRGEGRRSGAGLRIKLLTALHDHRANPFRQADPMTVLAPAADPAPELTLSRLDRALGRLPEAQRAVILLIGLEGLSQEETAAVLRISTGAVRARRARGRENLCRQMGVAPQPRSARAA